MFPSQSKIIRIIHFIHLSAGIGFCIDFNRHYRMLHIWGPYLLDSQLIRNGGQNLRSLIIQIEFRILFSEIASLLNHFPQLKKLSLATLHFTRDVEFYYGQKWEQLIQTSLPCLISGICKIRENPRTPPNRELILPVDRAR